jgi:uncharacterized protein YggU (UPF0235/DUF167 family)
MDLKSLAFPGAEIAVRVIPRAARNAVEVAEGVIRVRVTAVAEGGKANAAVVRCLADALGLPKSRLSLIRGTKARDKLFRVD